MADYVFSAPLTGTKVEELLLRVNNNQDFTAGDKAKLDSLSSTYFDLEDTFVDFTTQSGAPVDTPKTIIFGGLKTSASSIIRHNADGTFDMLKTGPLFIKSRYRLSRTGASGTSDMYLWVEISTDGGTTWSIIGQAVNKKLESAEDSKTFFDATPIFFTAGVKFRARFARSSTGSNFGDLSAGTPSATLQGLGVPSSPSAQTTIYKSSSWNYV